VRRARLTLLLAAVVACGGPPPSSTGETSLDLLSLLPFTPYARRTASVDFGDPSSLPQLGRGWSEPATLDDGGRGAWLVGSEGVVVFHAGPRPVALRADLDRRLVTTPDARRAPPGLWVFVNGVSRGQISRRGGRVSVHLPANLLVPGANVLSFRQRRHPAARAAPAQARFLFERITFEAVGPEAAPPGVSADGGQVVLQPGADLALYVRAPRDARLRLDATVPAAGPKRLDVEVQADGGRAEVTPVAAAAGRLEEDVALGLDAGAVARIRFSVPADAGGSVRIERALVVAPNDAHAPSDAAARRRNVVLYVADTVRADHLSIYGYRHATSPNLERLARGGVVFDRAVAQSSWTRPATASILTGRYPADHGAVTLRDRLRPGTPTMAELFREAGFASAAFVTNVNVADRFGFGRGFDTFEYLAEDLDAPRVHASADDLHARALGWLATHGERPFLLYLHATDAHAPYRPPAGQATRFRDPGLVPTIDATVPLGRLHDRPALLTAPNLAFLRSLYDGEIAALDEAIGRLLARLEDLGVSDRTVVVFVADHGEEFLDHGGLEHGRTLYDEAVRVPLVIAVPGSPDAGRRSAALARQIDLLPTVLDLCGISKPSGLPGQALLTPDGRLREETPAEAFSETWFGQIPLTALVIPPWKVIVPVHGARPAVYDLDADPAERNDLATAHPILVGYASQRIAELRMRAARYERSDHDSAPPLDAETLERLRALGYADGD
jgi:arylsulfatase A-like enzyme